MSYKCRNMKLIGHVKSNLAITDKIEYNFNLFDAKSIVEALKQ